MPLASAGCAAIGLAFVPRRKKGLRHDCVGGDYHLDLSVFHQGAQYPVLDCLLFRAILLRSNPHECGGATKFGRKVSLYAHDVATKFAVTCRGLNRNQPPTEIRPGLICKLLSLLSGFKYISI